jgi:hypothetical protein
LAGRTVPAFVFILPTACLGSQMATMLMDVTFRPLRGKDGRCTTIPLRVHIRAHLFIASHRTQIFRIVRSEDIQRCTIGLAICAVSDFETCFDSTV